MTTTFDPKAEVDERSARHSSGRRLKLVGVPRARLMPAGPPTALVGVGQFRRSARGRYSFAARRAIHGATAPAASEVISETAYYLKECYRVRGKATLHPSLVSVPPSLAAILVNCSSAASRSSAISAARMSGAGNASVSVRLLSLIQNRSRLSLSRLRSSS